MSNCVSVDQPSLNATSDREPMPGSCENLSQLAWGASGTDDTEGTSPEDATEVAAIVCNDDGSKTVLRHIGDRLKGPLVISSAMEAGATVREVLFKRVRGSNVVPLAGNLVPVERVRR